MKTPAAAKKYSWIIFPSAVYILSVTASVIMFAAGRAGLHEGNFPALLCLPFFFALELMQNGSPGTAAVILGMLGVTLLGFFFRPTRIVSSVLVYFWAAVPLLFSITCSNFRFMDP